jgi:hypothetical protein
MEPFPTAPLSGRESAAPVSLSAVVALRRDRGSESSPSFPSAVPSHGIPFPPQGLLRGRIPLLHRYYGMLRLPIAPPAALRFPSLGGTIHARTIRSPRWSARHRGARGFRSPRRYPPGDFSRMETIGPLKFLGNPCVRALFSDPGGTFAPGPCGASVRPSAFGTASAPAIRFFRGSIARPAHPLSTLRRMDHSTTTQDSLPATGQVLPDRMLPPARFQRKVSAYALSLSASHPPFPSFLDASRVAQGGFPPRAPTDPDVRN